MTLLLLVQYMVNSLKQEYICILYDHKILLLIIVHYENPKKFLSCLETDDAILVGVHVAEDAFHILTLDPGRDLGTNQIIDGVCHLRIGN